MPKREHRRKLNLLHMRKGEKMQTMELVYVLGRKPAGGMVARVLVTKDLNVKANDALIFDFTNEPAHDV